MPQGIVAPANQVVVAGNPKRRNYEVGANATLAKMLPKRFVIYDTVDYAVKEAGAKADNVLGILDLQPGNVLTDAPTAAGEAVTVIEDECDVVVVLASGGAAATPGAAIVTAADGKAAVQAVAAMGSQGSVVGHALTSGDPAAADVEIVIQLNLQREPAAAA